VASFAALYHRDYTASRQNSVLRPPSAANGILAKGNPDVNGNRPTPANIGWKKTDIDRGYHPPMENISILSVRGWLNAVRFSE
jgi:hypothetical protein